jgi:multiple sugar transport system permease protein/sn-glycerol 3-phosphate transport system permease protein
VIFAIQQVFTPIDIMTEGGPQNGTTNLFYMVYQYAFRTFNVGFGAAGTVIIFAFLLAITLLKMRTLDRHVQYQQ